MERDDVEKIAKANEETAKQEEKSQIIADDGEKPCCSKSLALNNQCQVRFICDDANESGEDGVTKDFVSESQTTPVTPSLKTTLPLTPLPSAFHHLEIHHLHDPLLYTSNESVSSLSELQSQVFRSGFSDSVLALPNLQGYAESRTELDDKQIEPQVLLNVRKEDDISRKFPRTNLVRLIDSNNNEELKEKDEFYSSLLDLNNNVLLCPKESEKKLIKHASYIFHKDRRADLERLTKLMPRGREYVLFNVFTDVARLFGYRGAKKKHVAFPEEFLEKYEQQGDVAGKDRFVPSAKQPYMGMAASTKKRKLSAVYSTWTVKSSEFAPRVDRVDDINKCELCCEKYCISCDCCRGPGKKDEVINIMNGYLGDLNMASIFLHGHTTRTFESAMSSLEFIKFHESLSSVAAPAPWSLSYSKQHLGILSGSIWVFTYCIRTIIQQARHKDAIENKYSLPSETSFRKIMEQYATLCLTIAENVKTVLQYSHNFYNFCKECIRILKVLQVHLGFKREIILKKPVRRGDGLDLNRKLTQKAIRKQNGVEIMVAKHKESKEKISEEETLEWKKFAELSGHDKTASLRHLLYVTTEGMNMVQTQLRFLLDDIVDSVKDTNEADLLFLLADMFDRIKFLENAGIRHMKTEREQISRTTSEFCNDFQSFVVYGQHIIKRFIEFRDMIHLSYEFMVNGLSLESVSEMVPATTFNRKRKLGCWGGGEPKQRGKKVVDKHQPKYQAIDFFRVYYMDAVSSKAEIYASRYLIHMDASKQPIQELLPIGTDVWGDIELVSPRLSFEEYVEPGDDDDDDDLGGAGDKDKEAPQIKPILVISESATTSTAPSSQSSAASVAANAAQSVTPSVHFDPEGPVITAADEKDKTSVTDSTAPGSLSTPSQPTKSSPDANSDGSDKNDKGK